MDLTFVVKQPLTKYKVITKSQISKRSDFLCKFKSLSDNIPGLPDVIYLNHLPIPSAYEKISTSTISKNSKVGKESGITEMSAVQHPRRLTLNFLRQFARAYYFDRTAPAALPGLVLN